MCDGFLPFHVILVMVVGGIFGVASDVGAPGCLVRSFVFLVA